MNFARKTPMYDRFLHVRRQTFYLVGTTYVGTIWMICGYHGLMSLICDSCSSLLAGNPWSLRGYLGSAWQLVYRSPVVWVGVDHVITWETVYIWIKRIVQLMQNHTLRMHDFSVINEWISNCSRYCELYFYTFHERIDLCAYCSNSMYLYLL
jgi:hypothetical protein